MAVVAVVMMILMTVVVEVVMVVVVVLVVMVMVVLLLAVMMVMMVLVRIAVVVMSFNRKFHFQCTSRRSNPVLSALHIVTHSTLTSSIIIPLLWRLRHVEDKKPFYVQKVRGDCNSTLQCLGCNILSGMGKEAYLCLRKASH